MNDDTSAGIAEALQKVNEPKLSGTPAAKQRPCQDLLTRYGGNGGSICVSRELSALDSAPDCASTRRTTVFLFRLILSWILNGKTFGIADSVLIFDQCSLPRFIQVNAFFIIKSGRLKILRCLIRNRTKTQLTVTADLASLHKTSLLKSQQPNLSKMRFFEHVYVNLIF